MSQCTAGAWAVLARVARRWERAAWARAWAGAAGRRVRHVLARAALPLRARAARSARPLLATRRAAQHSAALRRLNRSDLTPSEGHVALGGLPTLIS